VPPHNGRYDLLVIASFNKDYKHFHTVVEFHSQQQIPVAYCNDGRYGNSTISFKRDERNTAVFFAEPYSGRLPKSGDSILIADVTPGYAGAQVGVSNPHHFYGLTALAAIVHENHQNPPYHVAITLDAARQLMLSGLTKLQYPDEVHFQRVHSQKGVMPGRNAEPVIVQSPGGQRYIHGRTRARVR
jgi:hypothetical protein